MSQKDNPLEIYVAEKLKEYGDKYARPTRASGASTEIGDVYSNYFYVECKQQLTLKDAKISKEVWKKLLKQIPVHKAHEKPPMLVVENEDHDRFVVMDIDDFFRLIEEEDDKAR